MDPQVKSVVGTVLGYVATAAATWGVARGLVPEADKAAFVNILVTAVPLIVAAGVAEYKRRTASPKALIQQVNAGDNGVKVVPVNAPGPVVDEPLKGAAK